MLLITTEETITEDHIRSKCRDHVIRGPGPIYIYNSFTRGSGNITKEEIERLQSPEDQKICCEIVSARNNKEIYP